MAVAVKTSPGARSSGTPTNVALLSLGGVLYLVACLAIVFEVLPALWWSGWSAAGLSRYQFVGGSLLMLVGLALGVGLLWLGGRLLGPNPPAGVRAGVFAGFLGFLLALLLTRWASLWFEHWAFNPKSAGLFAGITPFWGAILTGVTGGVLLAALIRLFTLPTTQRYLVQLEEAGWFHATAYKPNQGRIVRRGTIIGILLLAVTGIWTLMSNNALKRGPADWVLNIPFTGKMAVDSLGDTEDYLKTKDTTAIPLVQVKWAGSSDLEPGKTVSVARFAEAMKAVLNAPAVPADAKSQQEAEKIASRLGITLAEYEKLNTIPSDVKDKITRATQEKPVEFLLDVNKAVYSGVEKLMAAPTLHDDIKRRLREVDNQSNWTDLSKLLEAIRKEATAAQRSDQVGWVMRIPTAIPVIDRFALRDANAQTEAGENVRVGLNLNPNFKFERGKVVTAKEFAAEEVRVHMAEVEKSVRASKADKRRDEVLEELRNSADGTTFKTRLRDAITETDPPLKTQLETALVRVMNDSIPERVPLAPATGTLQFASVPLIPSVQFTIPLLLLAASIWLAWRVVNLPAFADFLIATEAEMNKVSWTTPKRLFQDTIVVLVTVFLMAIFLLTTDYFWKTVLSWKPIGVINIPKDTREKVRPEERRW